ncbi:hypothetical protein RND71_010305 [Anisodus tanguticus]|uniref:Peroxisomal membrane protein PEX14 n=1 Tax=Anisodus tanguticus TaxID=243964 RepID=A0AAE1SIY5_9SOLA|nr:hypothetical protein RND71_010305 [Anisodus tanguticus]
MTRNQVYEAAKIYLRTKIGPNADRVRAHKTPKHENINVSIEKDEEINDVYSVAQLKWRLVSVEPQERHGAVKLYTRDCPCGSDDDGYGYGGGDPTPTVTSTQPVAANEDGKQQPSSTRPPQAAVQNLQPASAPSNSMTKKGYLSFHWTHAVIAVGFLAASGAGTAVLFKKSIIPRLKSWMRKVVMEEEDEQGIGKGKPSLAEEAAVAAKAAAAAAADVARASQEMLASKSEEKRYFEELTSLLNYQVREMKSMTSAIEKLEGSNTVAFHHILLNPLSRLFPFTFPFTFKVESLYLSYRLFVF